MTRPQMIRADTIDLQSEEAPSAKKHKSPPSKPAPNGSLAPHQAETLREVEEERAGEEGRSPRASWADGDRTNDLQQYAEELANGITNSLNGNKMQSEDALAIAQNGGAAGAAASDDGDVETNTDDDLDDDMMDKISSSPSIEDEDIDFEFVYALHTFVATVEGQANATKGDTMVLLDDSNSYWWLVRVVKDNSIGYLPGEHIETPTERLARLNKHRNIDLSATMLGDQAEKAKNPIKTAIRRRKKNVAFAAPTYVDYSDIDYSTEEEDGDFEKQSHQQGAQQQTQQQQEQQASSQQDVDEILEDESAKVEPLKPRASQKQVRMETTKVDDKDNADSAAQSEIRRDSNDMFDAKSERVTRNGTVRNTDSFFKDETIETKKITLTPGLLRDDNEPRGSNESKDSSVRQRLSLEKDLAPDKTKDDKKKGGKEKKEKEKKPSAIRSFFSRGGRKKSIDEDDDSVGKRSMDASADVTEKDVEETQAADVDSSPEKTAAPHRNPSKLHKQPRTDPSPTRKPGAATPQAGTERGPIFTSEVRANNVSNVPPATLRMVESDQLESQDRPSQKRERSNSKSLISKENKPQKVHKAKSRVELDDFDSPEEDEVISEPTRAPPEPTRQPSEGKAVRPTLPGAYPDSYVSGQTSASELSDQTARAQHPAAEERLSESPVHISPVISSSNPPALMVDTSSQEDRSSPVSSPSPELVDVDDRTHGKQDSTTTSTSATTTSTWNDANLRAFFDSGSDIRDLLVIVYDKNDVPPAGPDHPVVGTLFREQNARLAEITTQLDNMLGDWLARKQRLRGTL